DAEALTGDPQGRCWFHSDTNEESRQDARRRGGRVSRAPQRPVPITFDVTSPESILRSLDETGKALAAGQCDRGTANALGILAKNASEVHKGLAFSKRIRRLEELAGVVPQDGDTP